MAASHAYLFILPFYIQETNYLKAPQAPSGEAACCVSQIAGRASARRRPSQYGRHPFPAIFNAFNLLFEAKYIVLELRSSSAIYDKRRGLFFVKEYLLP